jgi:hypothetical protein
VLGYARIAGMPVVTGLYCLLLPLLVFAALGSSRYLVVAADSATAAILASGLVSMAPIAIAQYVGLGGYVALLMAGFLLLGRLFRLGLIADFFSQTVLTGSLTGVGSQVGISVLGEMLGTQEHSGRAAVQLIEVFRHLPCPGFRVGFGFRASSALLGTQNARVVIGGCGDCGGKCLLELCRARHCDDWSGIRQTAASWAAGSALERNHLRQVRPFVTFSHLACWLNIESTIWMKAS